MASIGKMRFSSYYHFKAFQIPSPKASLVLAAAKLFVSSSDMRQNETGNETVITLRIDNGGC